jgi:hypothetical protein
LPASRLAIERGSRSPMLKLTLAALATLPTDSASARVEALVEPSDRYGLCRVDEVITNWSAQRGTPFSPP